MKYVTFSLNLAEYEHLVTTLEGCYEEFEELMRTKDWFSTELTDRIETAIEIIQTASGRG
jgi:hypothetical protein